MLIVVGLGNGLRRQLLAHMLFGYSSANAAFLNSPHKGEHIDVQMETVGRRDAGRLGGCKRLVASSFPKISSCTIGVEQGDDAR